ncbi:hypothetical protein [Kitasatospora sp. NPDC093806]|uniref:hypothetical protein n=1 Tax=Kitasatospora sp. NPDC093806 TaxID=3155075 RepID=UPI003428E7F5
MSLIQIEGSSEVLRAVQEIPELHVVKSSVETGADGRYRVAAYASDQAVEAAIAQGANVYVVLSTEEASQRHERVAAQIRSGAAPDEEV